MDTSQLKVCKFDLSDVLANGKIYGADEILFTSCASDSRACRPGDLYVALIGAERDGHADVQEAIQNGAAAIVAERIVPAAGVPVCVVPDTRLAYGQICHQLCGNPSQRMNVVGVTGTNGKTCTSLLIQSVFNMAGIRSGVMGTLGYCDGATMFNASQTTPPAHVLADHLARMRGNGCTHGIVEVSSRGLAQKHTAGVEFDVACVTNVRRDHLDFHGSLRNYRNTKARLFEQVGESGFAVLNADDPVCRQYLEDLNLPALSIGMKHPAEITATLVERFPSEQTFLLHSGNETIPVRTRMIGDHHIYNCLIATAVGLGYEIDLPTIVRGLEAIDDIPGRLQRIECGQPYRVFVDHANTADALRSTLMTLREVTEGRLICVFGAEGDGDRDKRPLMGRQVTNFADVAVVTETNPGSEYPKSIIFDILDGIDDTIETVVEPDRAAAIEHALSIAEEGDCVVIAGKGHETHQIVGSRRFPFDDREVVRSMLYAPHPPVLSLAPRRAA